MLNAEVIDLLEWKDKVDGVDDILAEDINAIAHAVIDVQMELEGVEETIQMINEGGVE